MERVGPDRRRIPAERDPEAITRLKELQPEWLARKLELARLYWRVERKASFVFEGCASIGELALGLGMLAGEAAMLRDVGRALEHHPELETLLRERKLSLDSAAVLGELLRHPQVIRAEDDWVRDATVLTTATLRRRVRSRIEAWTQGRSVAALTVYVTDETREDFAVCRDLASRKARRMLSPGEAFGAVVKDYRTRHDPRRKPPRVRRVPPTHERPESRYVPASVVRALHARSGGTCEVPDCVHRMGLEICHVSPHARGSGREERDLLLLCHRHHVIYDLGQLGFAGWTRAGRPIFRATDGSVRVPRGGEPVSTAGSGPPERGDPTPDESPDDPPPRGGGRCTPRGTRAPRPRGRDAGRTGSTGARAPPGAPEEQGRRPASMT
jgi:hypothetical protein